MSVLGNLSHGRKIIALIIMFNQEFSSFIPDILQFNHTKLFITKQL
ncbi:hypothetical protein HMPREF0758_4949 [Serratia odorifera DSM 4582]|uniref:Uncharacterized protein n=1 Tax=Serratia odorifera DSM 4582 TaxID=667129 RepID=D4E9U9_SEROD|nr:hypothetical protein HMPREF0758_4949 [Serratia odorifera DSM 4582]